MASAKLQKPTNQTKNKSHDEHKFSQKMSGMSTWGNNVFGGGHKQQEHQGDQHRGTKKTTWFGNKQTTSHVQHCSCQCKTSDKNLNLTCTEKSKKEPSTIKDTKCNVCNDTKKRQEHLKKENREERKQNVFPEVKKEETEVQTRTVPIKGGNVCSEVKKERKGEHVTGNKCNTCFVTKKEHREDYAANHCFGNMANHWIEKISMMKKDKESKCGNKSSSSSSDSDSEDDASRKNKKEKRRPRGAKNTSE